MGPRRILAWREFHMPSHLIPLMEVGITVGDSLERVDVLGSDFDFVELGIDEGGVPAAETSPATVIERVAAVDSSLCLHLPFKQDLVTPVPEINAAIVDFLERLLEWGGAAGAEKAVLHGTARNPHDVALRETAIDQLREIGERASAYDVELVVENVGHQPRGFQLSVLADIAEQTDTAVCFDVGHAFMEDGQAGIERFLRETADRITHLHVHDVRSRGDTHLPIGAGEIDYEPVRERLEGFSGTVAVEVFTDDLPLLRDSARRIDDLLTEG